MTMRESYNSIKSPVEEVILSHDERGERIGQAENGVTNYYLAPDFEFVLSNKEQEEEVLTVKHSLQIDEKLQ